MSALQDTIEQAILDGSLFVANPLTSVPSGGTSTSWGLYNPRGSGKNIIVFSVRLLSQNTQPIAAAGVSAGFFQYNRDIGGSAVTVPTNVNSNNIWSVYGSAVTAQTLTDGTYVPPAAGTTGGYIFMPLADIQPQSETYLEDTTAIDSILPLILYPGDFFGGFRGVNLGSVAIRINFVQVNAS